MGLHRTDGIHSIPHSSMVTTTIAREIHNRQPRLKRFNFKAKHLSHPFLNHLVLNVIIKLCQHSKGQNLCQYPRRRKRRRIGAFEMHQVIFSRVINFFSHQTHRRVMYGAIDKILNVWHPKRIFVTSHPILTIALRTATSIFSISLKMSRRSFYQNDRAS